MKNLLIYQWTHLDGKLGGGVTIYVRNLMKSIIETGLYNVFYLNSGLTYTFDGKVKLIEVQSTFDGNVRSFEIVNAPFMAPVRSSKDNISKYIDDEKVTDVFSKFIGDHNIEIVHFNNFEGLSLGVLYLKQKYPHVKFIYSVHNYFPICTCVNLWQNEYIRDGHNCSKRAYDECRFCYQQYNYIIERFRRILPAKFPGRSRIRMKTKGSKDSFVFRRFEESNIEALNTNFDAILAVSNRVRDIMIRAGVNPEKIQTQYIGTNVANQQIGRCISSHGGNENFKIIYMGYMQREKGFFFLLDALQSIPDEIAEHTEVLLVARHNPAKNKEAYTIIQELRTKYHRIELVNGYTSDNQAELLKDRHLGIVPILWEDNLPQVAIEQVAYGVPILVSDLGGAQEICNDHRFVFKAGNLEDFQNKFIYIYNHREVLDDFWNHSMHLVTMEEHIEQINEIYQA